MKVHFRKVAKQLAAAIGELDRIAEEQNLAHLHRLVVDLKTSLPERHAYEQSPLLLDGLRVTTEGALPGYAERLRGVLEELQKEYAARGR